VNKKKTRCFALKHQLDCSINGVFALTFHHRKHFATANLPSIMTPNLKRVSRIWDQAPHNGFTALTRFQDQWFCAFREAQSHVSLDGNLRIITSPDGNAWESAALLTSPDQTLPDVREARFGITPDNRLMLVGPAAYRGETIKHQTYAWFSENGHDWSKPVAIAGENMWLWGFDWDEGHFYGTGYGCRLSPQQKNPKAGVHFFHSKDGIHMDRVSPLYQDPQQPNEAAILVENGVATALIRRELAPGQTSVPPYNQGTALLAQSTAPFDEWTVRDLGVFFGGPALLRMPNGKLLAAGRSTLGKHRTMLWEIDEVNAVPHQLLELPSGGDTGYPGLVWCEDALWMSYYSSHEAKTAVYLAEIEFLK